MKLFLGAIGGELSAELPFVLMHPKPNMKKILKADTLAEVEGFQVIIELKSKRPTCKAVLNTKKDLDLKLGL